MDRLTGIETSVGLRLGKHASAPWRINEVASDFRLEDVWALPVQGGAGDFVTLLDVMAALDPANGRSAPTRLLFALRHRLGAWFGWDDAGSPLPIPGTNETSLRARLPADLRNTATGRKIRSAAFTPLYRTDLEWAAELANQTVHGVIHLAWVHQADGSYRGQMGIYVKPRGWFGEVYMALIAPFRRLIVYPALLRQIEQAWSARPQATSSAKQDLKH